MSDESEESCLVNSKTQSLIGLSTTSGGGTVGGPTSGGAATGMPYTDGIQSNRSPSSAGSDHHHQHSSHHQHQQQQQQHQRHQLEAASPTCDYARMSEVDQPTTSPRAANNYSRGSHSQVSETGELIDFNEEIILSQFHADALKQAGCGRFQVIAAIIAGLGLCGHAIQVYSVFYILPSAEVEFCIRGNEKSWLGNITLVGLAVGALFWGGLAGRTGRRKTLLSCLGVSSVFSVIAAFMPTYGPFMMARFTAAVGVGGAVPAAVTYMCEVTPPSRRARIVALIGAAGMAGALVAGSVALLVVPLTGQMVMLENKEHFSAWHRYLLLVALPTVAAVFGLFWLPESPRYLLECGREVEALAIYQRIYRNNQAHGGYGLTELEMPTVRSQRNASPASVLAGMAHSVNMYWGSFAQLFGRRHRRDTLLMLGAWTAALLAYHGMTVYVMRYSEHVETVGWNGRRVTEVNRTYESVEFNASIENVVFSECYFRNCTFRRLFLNHVQFHNCSFLNTEFANVKTSRSRFENSVLDDVRFIDTDLTDRHFVNCTSNKTAIVRLHGSCDEDFEFNIFFDNLWRANVSSVAASLLAVLLVGELLLRMDKTCVTLVFLSAALALTVLFGSVRVEPLVVGVGGLLQGCVYASLIALALLAAETYATPLRSSALGLFMCGGHIGALLGTGLYTTLSLDVSTFAATVTATALVVPTIAVYFMRDSCALI